MSTFKAKVDFSGSPGRQLGPFAQHIQDQLAANVRTAELKSVMGAWSDPVKIIVT